MEPTTPFNLNLSIDKWLSQFHHRSHFRVQDIEELQSHLLDQIDDLMAAGKSTEEAFYIAVSQIGEPSHLREEYHKVHSAHILLQRMLRFSRLLLPSKRVIIFSFLFLLVNIGSIFGQILSNKQWQQKTAKLSSQPNFSKK